MMKCDKCRTLPLKQNKHLENLNPQLILMMMMLSCQHGYSCALLNIAAFTALHYTGHGSKTFKMLQIQENFLL